MQDDVLLGILTVSNFLAAFAQPLLEPALDELPELPQVGSLTLNPKLGLELPPMLSFLGTC